MFDIRDPLHPTEIAYFNPPTSTGWAYRAMSSPTFAPERDEIWYTDGTYGFYALKLTNGMWRDQQGSSGAIPCAGVCSYWIDNGFTPCEAPFPPGSYVDHETTPAPTPPARAVIVLEATLDSAVDWDLFICPPAPEPTPGVKILGEPCDNMFGENHPLPVGCHEDAATTVLAGQTRTLRAYNWSDPPARGGYRFPFM